MLGDGGRRGSSLVQMSSHKSGLDRQEIQPSAPVRVRAAQGKHPFDSLASADTQCQSVGKKI